MRLVLAVLLMAVSFGCTRAFWRRQADKETYYAINQRDHDPRWDLPRVCIIPPVESRLHDPFNPDHPPMPPDDPAAYQYMVCPNGIHGYRHWHKDGDAPWIEDPYWRELLETEPDGTLVLTPERAVQIGLLDSREYQTQLETLYETALTLTLDRFEFALHWFGTNDTTWTHFGSDGDETNTLMTESVIGFTRQFAAGGQLMAELANNFVFQFAGPNTAFAFSNIIVSFVQPLLQGAGRDVVLETLTEGERTLLYQVRTFAHYRKQFTFNIATQTFLGLLLQEQNIRNQRANLAAAQENYRLHQALLLAGLVSLVKLQQVSLSVKQAQLGVIQGEASLETAVDNFKFTLGLPMDIHVRLDDSLLAPFELNDPRLTNLQDEIDKYFTPFREPNQALPLPRLEEGYKKLKTFEAQAVTLLGEVAEELEQWKKQVAGPVPDKDEQARQLREQKRLAEALADARADLDKLGRETDKAMAALPRTGRGESTLILLQLAQRLGSLGVASQLFVIQTQVRVYLIKLKPVHYELADAVEYAKANRLDLMNAQAQVVDAWRGIAVAANQLKGVFNLLANANIATPGTNANPVDFRAAASTYTVGFHFEAPLNRLAQRNAYRASLIVYQQARRNFMAAEDGVEEQIRLDLRNLNLQQISFEIARQSLVSSALQLQSARQDLLAPGNIDPTTTLNILNALTSLLNAKNQLIGAWVSYETARYQLLLDLEALQLNDRGWYIDEYDNPPDQPAGSAVRGSDRQTSVAAIH
jgi:outer membrane protein TolC